MLHKFLENFIGKNIENYRIVNYDKNNDSVLFHHNLTSPKMPLFMCKIENELVVPRKNCQNNPYVKELLNTFSNNILRVNYRMYYDYDLEYQIDRENFIKSIEVLTKNDENYGTLLEIARFTYNSQNRLMAYDYQNGSFKLFSNIYPNIDIEEVESFLVDYDMIDEDENARFYLDLNSFEIYSISEEYYSEDEVVGLDDTAWEVCNMSEDDDIEELDLVIYFRSIYDIPNNNYDTTSNSSNKISTQNLENINWTILVDNALNNFLNNDEDMNSNILIVDNRTKDMLGKDSSIVDYILEDIGFKDGNPYFVDENYDKDSFQYDEIKEILDKYSFELLYYHKLLTMDNSDSYKKKCNKTNLYNILNKINNDPNYSVYIDVIKYYFDEDEKILYTHLNQDEEYNSYSCDEMLFDYYDIDDINCYSQKYLLANKSKLEETIKQVMRDKGISSYDEYGTILFNPFTKKAFLFTCDYEKNCALLSIDEDLKDTMLYSLVNRILKLDETIEYLECNEFIEIPDTSIENLLIEDDEEKEDEDKISFVSFATQDDYYMTINKPTKEDYDDDFVKKHKRQHSTIENDETIFGGSHLGENKSTSRNIEKKIDIYNYSNQYDEPTSFFEKLKNMFSK